MKFNETWLAALAIASIGAGACYVETPKHDLADAEAIRAAAREDASAGEEDAEAEDAGVSDAGRSDAEVDAEVDADTCACDDDESSDTPYCLSDGSCAACTESEGCSEGLVCEEESHTCVTCIEDAQCKSASKSTCNESEGICEECQDDSECTHIAGGLGVCNAGTCVACTPDKKDACLTTTNAPAACNPRDFTCTTRAIGETARCETCVSDDECVDDGVCVEVAAGAGSAVCLPRLITGRACTAPYIGDSTEPVLTANGEYATVCTLRIVGATCESQRDYRTGKRCGQVKPNTGGREDTFGSGSNAECGAAGADDGFCVYSMAQLQYRCTVACRPEASSPDCAGGSGSCGSRMHAGGLTTTLCSP